MKEKKNNDIMKKGANTNHTIDLQRNDMKRSTFPLKTTLLNTIHLSSSSFLGFSLTLFFLIISLHRHNFLS